MKLNIFMKNTGSPTRSERWTAFVHFGYFASNTQYIGGLDFVLTSQYGHTQEVL